eukprot:779915_1
MDTDPFSRLSRTLTLKKQRGTTGNGEGFLHANGDRSGEYGNIINAQIKEGIKFEERQSLCWEQMNNIKSQQMWWRISKCHEMESDCQQWIDERVYVQLNV